MTGDTDGISASGPAGLSLEVMMSASRRLDALSVARVIGEAADAVHKAPKSGPSLGTLAPTAIVVGPTGAVVIEPAGKPAPAGYTAPERLRGTPGDRRSDVFSLGVLLWEALAHERLFPGATDEAVKQAVLASEVQPPSSRNAHIPAELDAICKKALAREPADRYQSVKVMAAEIAAVLDNMGYPESNEVIARYVAEGLAEAKERAKAQQEKEKAEKAQNAHDKATVITPSSVAPAMPAPVPYPSVVRAGPPPPPPKSSGSLSPEAAALRSTVLGVAPVRLPEAAAEATASPPLPSIVSKPAAAPPPPPQAAAPPAPPQAAAPPAPPQAEPAAAEEPVQLVLGPIPGGTIPPFLPSKIGTIPPGALFSPFASAPTTTPPAPPAPSASSNAKDAAPAPAGKSPTSEVAALPTPPLPTPTASQAGALPAITAPTEAEGDPAKDAQPVSVAAVRSRARGDQSGGDMLAGWDWGSPGDPDFDESRRGSRKRVLLVVGGAAALLLVTVIALAARGSEDETVPPRAEEAKAWETTPTPAPPEPAPTPPTAPESATPTPTPTPAPAEPTPTPAPVEPTKPEPAVVPPEPAKPEPEPAKPEPAKPEPAKPELIKTEPTKADTKKADAKKADAKKADAKKADAKKADAKKADTKKADTKQNDVVAAKNPETLKPDASPVAPVEPYADSKPLDPSAAYKTGLQQFARGDTNAALATFRASLATNPGYAPTWRGIGLVYEKLGQKAQARGAFQKYLELAPSAGDAESIRERMGRLQ